MNQKNDDTAKSNNSQVQNENLNLTQPDKDVSTKEQSLAKQSILLDKKSQRKRRFKIVYTIVLAALLRALSLELLLVPNNITFGGAVGIASIFTWLFRGVLPVSFTGVFLLAVNIPLLLVAYFKTDKGFAIKTAVCLILMTIFMELLGIFDVASIIGTYPAEGEDKVLYALLGGALSGVSLPLMLSIQASTGGSDIVSMLLQKRKNGNNYLRVLLYIDIITIVIAATVSQLWVEGGDGMSVLIYSVAAQFVAQLVQNQIYKGYSSAYGLEIVTDKPKEVSCALSDGLHKGLTLLKVVGMYSHTEKTLIMCVIYKRQLSRARKIVRDADPEAFATVYTVKEVVGHGFRNTEEDLEDKIILHTPKSSK